MTKITLMRMLQVEAAVGLKNSAIYQRIKEGNFPQLVALRAKHIAFRSDETEEWVLSRPRVLEDKLR